MNVRCLNSFCVFFYFRTYIKCIKFSFLPCPLFFFRCVERKKGREKRYVEGENFRSSFVCCDNICLMYSVSETRNCCVHRETVLCALQGFQIKQMIFFHSKRVSAMRNIIQNGLFVIQKNVYTFLFPFLRAKLIHAGCFIILKFFKDLLASRATFKICS